MSYRLALAGLYVLLVATVAATIVFRLNPAVISAVAIPFVTLATATLARRRGKRVMWTRAQAAMSKATSKPGLQGGRRGAEPWPTRCGRARGRVGQRRSDNAPPESPAFCFSHRDEALTLDHTNLADSIRREGAAHDAHAGEALIRAGPPEPLAEHALATCHRAHP
jgi:hypothetical protein